MILHLTAIALQAAPAAQVCAPVPPALPAQLAPWNRYRPADGFVVGRAAQLVPKPIANVRLAMRPSRPLTGDYVASGSFVVKTAGTYQVAAGGVSAPIRPLWLDIAGADYKPLTATAHGHGPACTSITKVVEYKLKPGRYTFLATGLTEAVAVRVLIVRKP